MLLPRIYGNDMALFSVCGAEQVLKKLYATFTCDAKTDVLLELALDQ